MSIEESYPKDFQEFLQQFKSEEYCLNYLIAIRWPNGFVCPKCGEIRFWQLRVEMNRMCAVREANLSNKWNNLSWNKEAIIAMVSHYMVGSCTKDRHKCE